MLSRPPPHARGPSWRLLQSVTRTALGPLLLPLSSSLRLCSFPSRSLPVCFYFYIFQKISSRKGKGSKTKAQEIPV